MAAPTIDEITDEILNNADFEEQNSLSRAKAFVTAAKRFLILTPESQADQSSSMSISASEISNLMRRAQQFVDKRSRKTGAVRLLSASEGFRR